MKTKFERKIVSGFVLTLLSTAIMQVGVAQVSTPPFVPSGGTGVSTQPSTGASGGTIPAMSTSSPTIGGLPKLSVFDPANAPADCNKEIMADLNDKYQTKRNAERAMQYQQLMNGLVLTTPKADQMDCFQQAMNSIKNVMAAVNGIIGMFSGQVDKGALMQMAINMVLEAGCKEINQATSSIAGSLNSVAGGINGTVGQIKNTSVKIGDGQISVGDALKSGDGSMANRPTTDIVGGTLNGIKSTVESVNSTANSAGNTGSVLIRNLDNANPFGSSGK